MLNAVMIAVATASLFTLQPGSPPANSGWEKEESPYLSNVRQITSPAMGLKKAGEAYFSPDGNMIIFQAIPPGDEYYQIYTLKLDEAGNGNPDSLLRISTGAGACTCAYFHPDGKRVIFASSHLDPRLETNPRPEEKAGYPASGRSYQWMFNEYMDIFETNLDGTQRRRITDAPGYDAECAYSPDGRSIVFCSGRNDGDMEIYIMDSEGRNPRRITRTKGYDGGPFFSPDGTRVIYRSDRRGDGNLQIYSNNLEGTDEVALTNNNLLNWCPFWHPSGRHLIFTEGDHSLMPPKYDLVVMRTDGSDRTRITHNPRFDGLPAFSPDGKRLMWTSKRGPDDTSQIFIADYTSPAGFESKPLGR